MRLSHFDRALIHGLGALSRPPLIPDVRGHRMLVDITAECAKFATREGEMMPLIAATGIVGLTPDIHRGTVHEIARVMNDFDRFALGAHWDAARGVK